MGGKRTLADVQSEDDLRAFRLSSQSTSAAAARLKTTRIKKKAAALSHGTDPDMSFQKPSLGGNRFMSAKKQRAISVIGRSRRKYAFIAHP
jgi:hypothetical protein